MIVEQIEMRGLAANVVIARTIVVPKVPDPDIEHQVVWPPGLLGEFDIFGWSGGDE
ncbi:MAG: hypothetical protein K2X38_00730 [Gemmataceae bacterium]|nr:hypothetical protein [Gemmataceae bacterium]